jgi:hypothetical protein
LTTSWLHLSAKLLLAERVALVVGKDEATRTSLFEQTRDAYRLRSEILHHGFDYVTEDNAWLISRIGFQVIAKLIPVSTQINDIGKLITMCTKSKFGGPAFAEGIGPGPATPASSGDAPSWKDLSARASHASLRCKRRKCKRSSDRFSEE